MYVDALLGIMTSNNYPAVSRRKVLKITGVMGTVLTGIGSVNAQQFPITHHAPLNPVEGTNSNGDGEARFSDKGDVVEFSIDARRLTSQATTAEIHGDLSVDLEKAAKTTGRWYAEDGVLRASGKFTTAAQLAGNSVTVYTQNNESGELSGTIVKSSTN